MSNAATDRHDIEGRILDIIIADGRIDRHQITPDATLDSLGVPSIEVVMMLMRIEKAFDVAIAMDEQLAEAANLREFVAVIASRIVGRKNQP